MKQGSDSLPPDAVAISRAAKEVQVHWQTVKRWADQGLIRSWARGEDEAVILVSLDEVRRQSQWQLRQVAGRDE